jgi:hypothetical protein
VAGLGSETVTVVRGGRVDRIKGITVAETTHDVEDCAIIPRASRDEAGGWVQVGGYTVYADPEADIKADDQVICRGERCEVEGVPGVWRKRSGEAKALAVTLKSHGRAK